MLKSFGGSVADESFKVRSPNDVMSQARRRKSPNTDSRFRSQDRNSSSEVIIPMSGGSIKDSSINPQENSLSINVSTNLIGSTQPVTNNKVPVNQLA